MRLGTTKARILQNFCSCSFRLLCLKAQDDVYSIWFVVARVTTGISSESGIELEAPASQIVIKNTHDIIMTVVCNATVLILPCLSRLDTK
jgi:hypothetical protein